MKILLIIGIIVLLQNVFAKDNKPKFEKTIIVAERNTYMGIEQVGVSIVGSKITAISNTNLLSKNFPFYYGKFESKTNDILKKEIAKLKQKENLKVEIYPSQHDINIFVNGQKIPANDKRFDQALSIIRNVFRSSDLILKDGTIVKSAADLENLKCDKERNKPKNEKLCRFRYGYIHG